MYPYWLLFSLCSLFAFTGGEAGRDRRPALAGLFLIGLLTALMIGLRYEVGGDWGTYSYHFQRVGYMSFGDVLVMSDPGYYLVNWLGNALGAKVWAVNLFCGGIFAWGLIAFSRTLPQPWIALVVAIPYLVVVVAMGYSRQGVAIGFAMLGLAALQRGSILKMMFWIILAVPFHKTAVSVLPLVGLARARNRVPTLLAVGVTGYMLYYFFLESEMDRLVYAYIEQQYQSQGAFIRVLMNVVPATLFLLLRKRFDVTPDQSRLWRNFSIAALACLPALYLLASSTVIDRLALYLIPLQLFVLASLPSALGKEGRPSGLVMIAVLIYSAMILFVWLNFAGHADEWVPYRWYLTGKRDLGD